MAGVVIRGRPTAPEATLTVSNSDVEANKGHREARRECTFILSAAAVAALLLAALCAEELRELFYEVRRPDTASPAVTRALETELDALRKTTEAVKAHHSESRAEVDELSARLGMARDTAFFHPPVPLAANANAWLSPEAQVVEVVEVVDDPLLCDEDVAMRSVCGSVVDEMDRHLTATAGKRGLAVVWTRPSQWGRGLQSSTFRVDTP
jgi:hypothetical protein